MAKKLREEDLRLNIIVGKDQARKEILDLEGAVKDSTARIRAMRNEMAMLAKQGQTDSARYKELTKAVKEETTAVNQNKARLTELRGQLKTNDMTMKELSQRAKALRADLANVTPGTERWKQMNRQLQETENRLRQLRGQAQQTGAAMNALSKAKMAFAGITAAVYGVARVFSGAFNTIKDFEQANADLAVILGKNVGDIAGLTAEAERLGRTTEYTASEVTRLQIELAKLGFNERQIQAMEEPVLHFASAVGTDLPSAAALAGATLRMFGLQAGDTDDTLAALALATNKSALSFSYLDSAMSTVGPVARTFGFDVKDTTALLGVLANSGFDASSAATATRNIFLKLADSSGALAKALGGPVRTFPELIAGLQKLDAKGVDLATTLELTDNRSVAAFNAFLRGADDAMTLRDELDLTNGVLKDMAEQKMDTLEGSLKKLSSAWEGFILQLQNAKGPIKDAVDGLTNLLGAVTKLMSPDAMDEQEASRRTSDYVGGLWSLYKGDPAKVSQAIKEDEENIGRQLKEAEERLGRVSGIRNKKRVKQQIQEFKDGLAVVAAARKELEDRIRWEAGTYYDSKTTSTTKTPPGGDSDKKTKKTWSLSSDEGYLKAKAELTRQYNEGEIKTQQDYEEQLYQLELSSLKDRLVLHKETGADRAHIEEQIEAKTMAHNAKVQKQNAERAKKEAELAAAGAKIIQEADLAARTASERKQAEEEARYEAEKKKFEGHKDVLEAIERKHRQNMMQIRIEAENEAFQQAKSAHELARQQLENQWAERIATVKKGSGQALNLQKAMAVELAQYDLEYLEALRKVLEGITAAKAFDGVELSPEQLQAFEKQLADVVKQINAAQSTINSENAKLTDGTGGGSLFGVGQAQWEQLFDNLTNGKMKADDLATALNAVGGMAQEGFKLANQAISLTAAKEKKELDDYKKGQDDKSKTLKKRLDAGLITEDQYNAEVEAMEEEYEAKKEEMELKQAQRQKAMSIVESIINTALGVTKTLAQFGIPAGIAPAAIMTAMGTAQTAMIAAQPVGYEEGGPITVKRKQDGKQFPARLSPDKRGFIDEPTVLVGESGSEYVIPHEALENPSILPFVNTLETARRNGRLRSIRLEAVQPEVVATGRASGGFIGEDGTVPAQVQQAASPILSAGEAKELLALLRKMDATFSKPITAEVAMLGRRGIVEKTEEYNRQKSRGKL